MIFREIEVLECEKYDITIFLSFMLYQCILTVLNIAINFQIVTKIQNSRNKSDLKQTIDSIWRFLHLNFF